MEIDHFSKQYGNFFYSISEFELEPLLKFEATLFYSLQRILQYQIANPVVQLMTLTNVEAEIQSVLFRKGSTFKFIFQDHF